MKPEDEEVLQEIGRRAFLGIQTFVSDLTAAQDSEEETQIEAAETAIQEDPLSILTRDGWRFPGAPSTGPEEYEILLSTGGPATRITGQLDEHCEPCSADLQAQDWFTPWRTYRDADESVLLAYARQFYYGD